MSKHVDVTAPLSGTHEPAPPPRHAAENESEHPQATAVAFSSASSVSSELSYTPSKAASETTADTSVAGDAATTRLEDNGQDEPSSRDKAATDDDSDTTAAGTSKATDKIEVLADKPGYRKELRTSPSGNKYLIETQGLWTTLRSLTPVMKKRSLRERIKKKLLDFATF